MLLVFLEMKKYQVLKHSGLEVPKRSKNVLTRYYRTLKKWTSILDYFLKHSVEQLNIQIITLKVDNVASFSWSFYLRVT